MAAAFSNLAVFKDDDGFGVADRGESVGDDEDSTAFHELIHSGFYQFFGMRVNAAGSFIQNEDRRGGDSCPCYCQQLALSLA